MDPLNQNKMNPKVLGIVGVILLVLILLSVFLTVGSNKNKVMQQTQEQAQVEKLKIALSLTPTPTYVPPSNFKYSTVAGVNFLPKSINGFTVEQDTVLHTAQQVYPQLDGIPLMNKINADIFAWLALNEFYQTVDPAKVSTLYKTNKIDNMSMVTKDVLSMKTEYNTHVMKLDGFFLKLRYKGTLPGNLTQLKKAPADLEPLARQLITNYRDQIAKDPAPVLDSFNKNNTVLLLNNREASRSFTNYPVYPALVADTDYNSIIQSLSVGQVSDIIKLTTILNGSTVPEDYAYAVFYISKKIGDYLPVDALANGYVAKAIIQ